KPNRLLSAIGGYLQDLGSLAQGIPINPHSYLKYLALRALGKRTAARWLIESGTFLGVTSARCSKSFERVITIELDPELARQAASFLKKYPNVNVIQGDAVKLLPSILAQQNCERVVVFLDGHFSGGITAQGELPEPALVELEVLSQYISKVYGIIIDDFR